MFYGRTYCHQCICLRLGFCPLSNIDLSLEEIFDHVDTYQGKIVAVPVLQVRASMGSDISAFDDTKTIIIGGFPYPVLRNDLIGLVGMYHPTSASPIKVYDNVFYTVYDEDGDRAGEVVSMTLHSGLMTVSTDPDGLPGVLDWDGKRWVLLPNRGR